MVTYVLCCLDFSGYHPNTPDPWAFPAASCARGIALYSQHCCFVPTNSPRQILVRVLYLWAIRHPASSYVQGINELLIPFFVVFLSSASTNAPCHHNWQLLCLLTCIHNYSYVRPPAGMENVEDLNIETVPRDVVSTVEADCYWCLSALLADIQVRPRLS